MNARAGGGNLSDSDRARVLAAVERHRHRDGPLLEILHGVVEVKSLPGEGSVFSVRLPRHFQAGSGVPA